MLWSSSWRRSSLRRLCGSLPLSVQRSSSLVPSSLPWNLIRVLVSPSRTFLWCFLGCCLLHYRLLGWDGRPLFRRRYMSQNGFAELTCFRGSQQAGRLERFLCELLDLRRCDCCRWFRHCSILRSACGYSPNLEDRSR